MSQKETVGISVRFDLTNEDERRAWEYLKGIGKKEHRFYTQAIVAAVNDYYGRREQIISDPYLETREKEDAFLRKVLEVIEQGIKDNAQANVVGSLITALQQVSASSPLSNTASEDVPEYEYADTMLKFAGAF